MVAVDGGEVGFDEVALGVLVVPGGGAPGVIAAQTATMFGRMFNTVRRAAQTQIPIVARRCVAALLSLWVIASVIVSCGQSHDANVDADDALIEALADEFTTGAASEDLDVFCMAEGYVNAVGGAERLENVYGVTANMVLSGEFGDASLSVADAESVADVLLSCAGFKASLVGSFGQLPADQATCMAGLISDGAAKTLLVAVSVGDQEMLERALAEIEPEFLPAYDECAPSETE